MTRRFTSNVKLLNYDARIHPPEVKSIPLIGRLVRSIAIIQGQELHRPQVFLLVFALEHVWRIWQLRLWQLRHLVWDCSHLFRELAPKGDERSDP
jgi:hypothetical protein